MEILCKRIKKCRGRLQVAIKSADKKKPRHSGIKTAREQKRAIECHTAGIQLIEKRGFPPKLIDQALSRLYKLEQAILCSVGGAVKKSVIEAAADMLPIYASNNESAFYCVNTFMHWVWSIHKRDCCKQKNLRKLHASALIKSLPALVISEKWGTAHHTLWGMYDALGGKLGDLEGQGMLGDWQIGVRVLDCGYEMLLPYLLVACNSTTKNKRIFVTSEMSGKGCDLLFFISEKYGLDSPEHNALHAAIAQMVKSLKGKSSPDDYLQLLKRRIKTRRKSAGALSPRGRLSCQCTACQKLDVGFSAARRKSRQAAPS